MNASDLEDEFGDVIAKARIGRGYPVSEVAQMVDLSERDIESIEAYRLRPDREHVAMLAVALSLDPGKLAEMAEDAWAPAPVRMPSDRMIVESVTVSHGGYRSNCYILGCSETHAAAVVDPGGAADAIASRIADLGLKLEVVLVTHAHGDHIGGLRQLVQNNPGVRLVNHQMERDSVTRGLANRWEPARDGMPIHLGSLVISPLFTPGHTPGSTCYHANGVCFTGDTLFAGSIGRPAGPQVYEQMLAHIRTKILSLPDDTVILPGHGPATTVGDEKAHNAFF